MADLAALEQFSVTALTQHLNARSERVVAERDEALRRIIELQTQLHAQTELCNKLTAVNQSLAAQHSCEL